MQLRCLQKDTSAGFILQEVADLSFETLQAQKWRAHGSGALGAGRQHHDRRCWERSRRLLQVLQQLISTCRGRRGPSRLRGSAPRRAGHPPAKGEGPRCRSPSRHPGTQGGKSVGAALPAAPRRRTGRRRRRSAPGRR